MVNASDTLLVVFTLNIVHDYLFAAVSSVLKELIIVPVGTMGCFLLEDNPFKTAKGSVDYV